MRTIQTDYLSKRRYQGQALVAGVTHIGWESNTLSLSIFSFGDSWANSCLIQFDSLDEMVAYLTREYRFDITDPELPVKSPEVRQEGFLVITE